MPFIFILKIDSYKNFAFKNTNPMEISTNLNKNEQRLKDIFNSDDIRFSKIKIKDKNALLVFIADLTDLKLLGDLVLRPLSEFKAEINEQEIFNTVLSPEKKEVTDLNDTINEIIQGATALFVDGLNTAFVFGLRRFEKRSIAEPPTSTVIKGPREGFVESLPVNVSLMRRRIKSTRLKFEYVYVGHYSNTPVCLCYVSGVAKKHLIKKLKAKLSEIKIDAILDSSYVSKFISERKTSLFKQVGNTEKPDILAAKILEGRVAIFVDGSPIALTVPYLLIEDFQSPSDYYNSSYSATFARSLRLISIIVSIFLPAYFVSAELFHLQLIPLSFLLTIVNSIKGIPLSPSSEMLFTLLIFEILNEASVRMPKYVGMVVSIVGGLVLGETAVNAGIISAPVLMIVAFSGICLYTVPELEQTSSIIRLIFLVVAGSFGGYGLILSGVVLIIYLVSSENYGAPVFAPFSPLIGKDLKDSIYKGFLVEQKIRPISISNQNKRRLEEKQ